MLVGGMVYVSKSGSLFEDHQPVVHTKPSCTQFYPMSQHIFKPFRTVSHPHVLLLLQHHYDTSLFNIIVMTVKTFSLITTIAIRILLASSLPLLPILFSLRLSLASRLASTLSLFSQLALKLLLLLLVPEIVLLINYFVFLKL